MIFLSILCVILILNTTILVYLAVLTVRMREFLGDLLVALGEMSSIPVMPSSSKAKTWDEKFEEELDFLAKRMKTESGLSDLPDPKVSWGEPPAPNPQEGLIIVDK